jgi:DNA-binding PadR family transcriptional regulator
MHGYEMIRELQERSGGAWRPSAGSIYPTLQLLEDEGLVASTEETGKRQYSLTDAGRDEIARRGGSAPWEEFTEPADSPWHELRDAGMGLMAAAMQGAHAANAQQLDRITETLREARSRIYRILGDDEPADRHSPSSDDQADAHMSSASEDTYDGDSDSGTDDRHTSDRDTSDRHTSDRHTSDRHTSDRDTSDRDTSDGDNR